MKTTWFASFFAFLFLTLNVYAGAWDVGPFDNDDALDWTWELEESNDLTVIETALKSVTESSSYIEAPTASSAIAAAEVIAALNGKPHPQLPENVVSWVKTHNLDGNEVLIELALQVAARVQDPGDSELAQLWSDSEELHGSWKSGLSDLKQRLQ